MWLDMDDVNKWKSSEYPKSVKEQPILRYNETATLLESDIQGMIYDNLYGFVWKLYKNIY